MAVFALTLLVMLVVVIAMSIGVVFSGRRLRGSCGGLASGSCACRDQGLEVGAACRDEPSPPRLYALGDRRKRRPD